MLFCTIFSLHYIWSGRITGRAIFHFSNLSTGRMLAVLRNKHLQGGAGLSGTVKMLRSGRYLSRRWTMHWQ